MRVLLQGDRVRLMTYVLRFHRMYVLGQANSKASKALDDHDLTQLWVAIEMIVAIISRNTFSESEDQKLRELWTKTNER